MTAPATMTTCPNEETLAAFIDGRLKQDARNELIEHIAGCAECRDVMAAARELESENEIKSENVREFPARRSYIPAAIAAIAAGIVVVAFVPEVRDLVSLRVRPLASVKTAYEPLPYRTVEARLNGFPYKAYKGPTRSSVDERFNIDELAQMQSAAADLQDGASKGSWKAQRARALAFLMIGDRDEALRAIELGEQAGGGSDAGFLNDAAAVYLARASYSAKDRARALKAAERAWAAAKTPESAWNRALAYQMNDRTAEATRAWKNYLAMDGTSEWATEAQEYLDRLKISAQP